uniref:Uncharacterized protein n=1 Tax=Podoviridae sp. ctwJH20 TaxID=2827753 RepID=A0A8S5TBF9_9CAUD|nr:MAG TPA: hypothetical protein [Podoviridae sp. ctwJH20]
MNQMPPIFLMVISGLLLGAINQIVSAHDGGHAVRTPGPELLDTVEHKDAEVLAVCGGHGLGRALGDGLEDAAIMIAGAAGHVGLANLELGGGHRLSL